MGRRPRRSRFGRARASSQLAPRLVSSRLATSPCRCRGLGASQDESVGCPCRSQIAYYSTYAYEYILYSSREPLVVTCEYASATGNVPEARELGRFTQTRRARAYLYLLDYYRANEACLHPIVYECFLICGTEANLIICCRHLMWNIK